MILPSCKYDELFEQNCLLNLHVVFVVLHDNGLILKAGEMGDDLPFVDLGTGRYAVALTCGRWHTCVLLDNADVKVQPLVEPP